VVKSYSEETIRLFNQSILEDEFNDSKQNESIYDQKVSGFEILYQLVHSLNEPDMKVLSVGSGSSSDFGFASAEYLYLEPNEERAKSIPNRILGWCENIETSRRFHCIVCWGTLCFVRSLPESLIQFNNRLVPGYHLVLDVVKSTNMPLAQTVDPDSFVKYAELFGFELEHRIPFGHDTHQREGFRFKKVRDFDPAYLRIPQCNGDIRNFMFSRDWFLK
jgi:hypothetical protein